MTDEQRARLNRIAEKVSKSFIDTVYREEVLFLLQLINEQERKMGGMAKELMDTVVSAFPSLKLKYERERVLDVLRSPGDSD